MAACADPAAQTTQISRHGSSSPCPAADVSTTEGLRQLLTRLHDAGADAWRTDVDAHELMQLCTSRYGALARKYDQTPEDAAAAAFEALRHRSTQSARDPWAVVTTAVRITLIAEWRAAALLTSATRARRSEISELPTVERFCERPDGWIDHQPTPMDPRATDRGSDLLLRLVTNTVGLLVISGWQADATGIAVAYICDRLADLGSRVAAYEALRRDKAARAAFDLSHDRWIRLLRITLGHDTLRGPARHGLLARILAGDHPDYLLTSLDLAATSTEELERHDG